MMSYGPAWCHCDGYLRWLRYPGMRHPYLRGGRAAVKPSLARRRAGRHASAGRRRR